MNPLYFSLSRNPFVQQSFALASGMWITLPNTITWCAVVLPSFVTGIP
jgi:hypothetical protein